VAQKLFENYQMQSEDVRKKHEDSKLLLQVSTGSLSTGGLAPPELVWSLFLKDLDVKQAMAKWI
jgi:hypothetical protein